VFNSQQQKYTPYGSATNWNGTGLDQIFPPPCKFRVKFGQTASWCNNKRSHFLSYKSYIFCR